MEEIKIYHSLWRMLLLFLGSILFVCGGIYILHMHKNVYHLVVGWVSILFFGCCGIVLLWSFLKERLFDQPHLTINDEGISYRGMKTWHVRFADVASFDGGRQHLRPPLPFHEQAPHQCPGVYLRC